MQIVQIEQVSAITAAMVLLRFRAKVGQVREPRQVIVPMLHSPGVGDLVVYLANNEDRPDWMRSPLLCYHGRGEAMGRPNHGGLLPCREWPAPDGGKRWSLVTPRMSDDPLCQEYVVLGLDVTNFYLGGTWRRGPNPEYADATAD